MRRHTVPYDIQFGELGKGPSAPKQFENDADAVISGWLRVRDNKVGRLESPNSWFKRNAYRFLKRYVNAGKTAVFEQAIRHPPRQLGKRLPQRHLVGLDQIRDNPFKLGLFAMFSDDTLTRSDRHVFGNQMLYAHRHDVPPQHLIAFIRGAGSPARIAAKLRDNAREPVINFGGPTGGTL
jgi:hypothetical protein